MNKDFYKGNRERLYAQLQENSLLVLFAGVEVRKTNDEFYPFYTNRNFLYLTGLDQKELALIARKDGQGQVAEKVYILPPDWMAERWTGTRIKPNEATDLSGIQEIGYVADFEGDLHKLATSGNYQHLYLDLYRVSPTDRDELAKLLHISDTQLGYITNVSAGCGLIRCAGNIVPFENSFPRHTQLYKLMTTKPDEALR